MKYSPYLLLILTNLFYSFNIVIGKYVTGVIPPITLTLLRWLGSLIILLPFCWQEMKANWRFTLTKWPLILILGAIGYSLSSILAYESVYYSTAVNVSFINAFMPVMVAVMSYLLYREAITKAQSIGFILSITGVIWIIFQGDWTHLLRFKVNIGDLFMVLNVCLWPIFPSLYKHRASNLPRLSMLAWMIAAGLVITIPGAIVENMVVHGSWFRQVRLAHMLALLGLCIFPSILANQFQNTALKYVSTNKVGIFQALIPIFASAIAIVLLGEKLFLYHIFGGLFILSGVFLVIRYGPKETKPEYSLS